MKRLSIQCAILLGTLVMLMTPGTGAQTLGSPERFTALAVNVTRGGTVPIEIAVNRWSTDRERDRLLKTLTEQGPGKLLDVLTDTPKVGSIREASSIGWDLRYARHTALPDGGETVVVVTDRPISTWEAANQPRTIDYPFTLVEMHLNASGEGEGVSHGGVRCGMKGKDEVSVARPRLSNALPAIRDRRGPGRCFRSGNRVSWRRLRRRPAL